MNQQVIKNIPEKVAWYFSGFVDGEGSFNVALIPRNEYRMRWKIYLTFNVAQKDQTVLALMKRYFGAGRLEQRKDGIWNYSINDINALVQIVVPFFKKYHFLSASKKRNFSIFQQIVEMVSHSEHLTQLGIERIIALRERLNEGRGRKRKYALSDYQKSRESSETNTSDPE